MSGKAFEKQINVHVGNEFCQKKILLTIRKERELTEHYGCFGVTYSKTGGQKVKAYWEKAWKKTDVKR